ILLQKLKGITFGICSNTNISTTKSRKLNNNLPEGYDFQILSYEVGLLKPDREIFELVIEKSKCKPNEIIYADDNANKLYEAANLGIHTHVYTEFASFRNFCKNLGLY